MDKSVIYYTPNDLDPLIMRVCQEQLKRAWNGEIISCSLKPINFGRNFVLEGAVKSYPTMTKQILMALEHSTAKYVFFCEHDVLYHPSHFEFTPARDDIYYYNVNNWRWRWGTDIAITYDYLTSLSQLCCNRELAIAHYKYRLKTIEEQGLDKDRSREPRWARRFGYEPGTKPRRRGGITDEEHEKWRSKFPNIDIRHKGTFSHPKTFLDEFHHKPTESWMETNIKYLPGWDVKTLFNL